MIDERELWQCAQWVLDHHGQHAPLFVATRIGQLVLAQDAAGVKTWQSIAARISQLMVVEGDAH